jgi:Zn-dependent protease/predicted transcriptional regulator
MPGGSGQSTSADAQSPSDKLSGGTSAAQSGTGTMFGRQIKLFTLFGFTVKIDLSWVIIAGLITWSLSEAFRIYIPGLTTGAYWGMGAVGALGLFVSIVAHEFSHSLVARGQGMEMRGITLFIFGGVAEMDDEPPSAGAEFKMAIAGPLASVVIGLVCGAIWWLTSRVAHAPVFVTGILAYLGVINVALAVFNLLPAFPLDGGRVFRAALWYWGGNLRWATRIAAYGGSLFGILLIIGGVISFFMGDFIGGVWWFLLGLFVRFAAQTSYQQLLMRQVLEGQPVERYMQPNVETVEPSLSVEDLVEDHIYRRHYRMFPVIDDGRLVGCVTLQQVKNVPRQEWPSETVRQLMEPCSKDNVIDVHATAMDALKKMNRTGSSRLMVTDGDQLRGIISLRDLMRMISSQLELEESNGGSSR